MSRSLPYQNATSGERSLQQVQKILLAFGCSSFGHMHDIEKGEVLVQFRYRDQPVSVKASVNGYAAAWLKIHPWGWHSKRSKIEHERKAKQIASVAVHSILRDWIKGQVTAVETGVLSFEGAFLGQLLLPNGQTVLEAARARNLLPAPAEEKVVDIKK